MPKPLPQGWSEESQDGWFVLVCDGCERVERLWMYPRRRFMGRLYSARNNMRDHVNAKHSAPIDIPALRKQAAESRARARAIQFPLDERNGT